eukprot:GFUD01135676.1.p1 GENE.GFUD01135676.1~~GFUD01135676.1.p1  ORF type:complete len:109 (-),score=12.71 GFUD01135676.1:15-341(-)
MEKIEIKICKHIFIVFSIYPSRTQSVSLPGLTMFSSIICKSVNPITRNIILPHNTALARGFAHTTWVSGPPRTRISFTEKVIHGVVITAGVLAGPMWILLHIKDYQKR